MLQRPTSLRIAATLLMVAAATIGKAGAAEPEIPANAVSAEPTDLFTRCLAAVVDDDPGEGAWCDVRIDELNRVLGRSVAQAVELAAAYHNRAVLALRRGDLEAARADLGAALALAPATGATSLTRGNLELKVGNFEAALGDFNEAVTLVDETQLALALENRALALRGLGDVVGALRDVEAARRLTEPGAEAAANQMPQAGS